MSAVLVTGGRLSASCVKALAARGESVVIFDNFSQGTGRRRDATVVEGDIQDTATLAAAIRTHRFDAVMHFAAWLSVGDSVKDPAGYYRNNVVGALSVLEAMVATGVRHFVFSSTCASCGTPDTTPIHEDLPKRPINAYGETKLAIEHALPHFEHAYGLRSVALRYFNAAGADVDGALGEDHAPEIHVFRGLDAAMGPVVRIFGDDYPTPDGTCLRDYVHVNDLARHVLPSTRCAAAPSMPQPGNGRPTSVRDVLASVERVTGKPVPRTGATPGRGSRGALRVERPHQAGARLAPALRGARRDRRDRVALASRASCRLCHGVGLMSRLKGQLANPLLSVVMPVYNERQTIEEIVRRVLAVPLASSSSSSTTARRTGRGRFWAGWRRNFPSRSSCSPPTPAKARRCAVVSRR
jgi:UDP-glucose-4-epimerase GalE